MKATREPGTSPKTAPSAPTMIAPPPVRPSGPGVAPAPVARPDAANEQTVLAGIPADQETSDARETVMPDRNGEARPYPGRPSAQLPTEHVSPLAGPRAQLDGPAPHPVQQSRPRTLGFLTPWRTRPHQPAPLDARQRRIRSAAAGAGRGGRGL